jgi:phosphatidylglycerophosphatase C
MTLDARGREPTSVEVVVFDFDGTLVKRDSFLDFSVRYCLRHPARVLLVVALLPLSALFLAAGSMRRAASTLLWGMTLGVPTRRFAAALRRYSRDVLPRYACEFIFSELTRHAAEGRHVVIATGTLPLVVRNLLRVRNLRPLPIVGSRLRRKWGGLVAVTHCTGPVKVRELERRFGILHWSTVFTNSFADSALLTRARDITLVGPSARTLLQTRQLAGTTAALRVLPAS